MSGNPVTWFEIYVKDMPRAKAFYEKTLGIKLEKLETPAEEVTEMWSFPMGKDSYGATGALVKMQRRSFGWRGWHHRLLRMQGLRGRGRPGSRERRQDHEGQVCASVRTASSRSARTPKAT